MALGGGTFISQNKVLPGSYINFISAARASAELSDRGIATMPLELNWGIDNAIFTVTKEDFIKNTKKIFGYAYTDEEMKGLRDLFMYANTLHAYKLTSDGVKASNTYATAKYCGTRGNDIKTVIQTNVDDTDKFDVITYLGTSKVDAQTVSTAADLIANDFVEFKPDATLSVTAGVSMTGGTNGTVNGDAHQAYLDKIESYAFNTMGAVVTDDTTKALYAAFTKRLRDEMGVKFQTVLYNKASDYEGVINVKNKVTDAGWSEASLVYWVTGAEAGCAVNASLTNALYDGEFTVEADYTQPQLITAIEAGELVLHRVSGNIRILTDINSLVTTTEDTGDDFKSNQTMRVVDQIANDIAVIFNTRYIGKIPNNDSGRVSLWKDIVKHHQALADIGAIENFNDTDVTVSTGETKKAVVVSDYVTIVNAMEKLYMTVTIA